MVPKKFRLPKEELVAKPERTLFLPSFRMKAKPNGQGHNRYAVIVGSAVEKRAARRHFLKRIFMNRLLQWPNLGKDFLVIVSPKGRGLSKKIVTEELHAALQQIHT